MTSGERGEHDWEPMPSIFVDDCSLCGKSAHFTGRFAPADANGWQCALFYCDRCRHSYRIWRQGLAQQWRTTRAWILLRHDPRAPSDPAPALFHDRRAGLLLM